MSRVAIIGLGPSGAFAARAAFDAGSEVDVYLHGNTTPPPGAFWFHELPPTMKKEYKQHQIYMVGKGKESAYQNLQWGKLIVVGSSFPKEPYFATGYNPAEVMDDLVPSKCDTNMIAHPFSDVDIADLAKHYDHVFQTFPTKESKEQQPELIPYFMGAKYKSVDPDKNFAVYNGTGKGIVVRQANLFGNLFYEFPKGMSLSEITNEGSIDISELQMIQLRDLHPSTKPWQTKKSNIHLIGRWAEWNKNRLAHEIYSIVYGILKKSTTTG